MGKSQKLNWCFTCKFSVFAQAYTGLKSDKETIKYLAEEEQISYALKPQFLTVENLSDYWNKYIEIKPQYKQQNGITALRLDGVDFDITNADKD